MGKILKENLADFLVETGKFNTHQEALDYITSQEPLTPLQVADQLKVPHWKSSPASEVVAQDANETGEE